MKTPQIVARVARQWRENESRATVQGHAGQGFYADSGASGAFFNSYTVSSYIDDVLDVNGNDVESRATRATHATADAQHWLDSILDNAPVIAPQTPAQSTDSPKTWRLSIPGREPFNLICVQGADREELLDRYPRGTIAEPIGGTKND